MSNDIFISDTQWLAMQSSSSLNARTNFFLLTMNDISLDAGAIRHPNQDVEVRMIDIR